MLGHLFKLITKTKDWRLRKENVESSGKDFAGRVRTADSDIEALLAEVTNTLNQVEQASLKEAERVNKEEEAKKTEPKKTEPKKKLFPCRRKTAGCRSWKPYPDSVDTKCEGCRQTDANRKKSSYHPRDKVGHRI